MILRPLVVAALALIGVPLLLVGAAALLAFRGSPGACGGGRLISDDPALAFAYDDRWFEFNSQLGSGLPATITVTESEATSRADLFLLGSPVDDARVCLVDGGADINATIAVPWGPDLAVRARGSADLSGEHPRAHISSMRIGGLPNVATRPFRGLVSRIIDDQMDQIELDHRLSVEVHDGEAVITGTP